MIKLRELVILTSIIIAFSMIYRQFIMDLEFQLMPNSESFLLMYLFKGKILNFLSCIISEYGKYIIIFPVIYFSTENSKKYDYIITSKNDLIDILKMSIFIISGSYVLSEGIFEIISSSIDLLKSKVSFFSYFNIDFAIISVIKIATGLVLINFQKRYLTYKTDEILENHLYCNYIPSSWIISILLSSAISISIINFIINIYRNSFNFNVSSKDIIPLFIGVGILVILKIKGLKYLFSTNNYLKFFTPFLCCSYLFFLKFSVLAYKIIIYKQKDFNYLIIYASISFILIFIFLIISIATKTLIKEEIV
jgi:hypothetical protein